MKKYLKYIFTSIAFIILAVIAVRYYIHKTYPPDMGFKATELITVDGNIKTSINDFKGNVVIVSCFQTWCGACAGETPVLNKLAANLKDEKFSIIYITDETGEKLQSFRARLASDRIIFTYSLKSLASLGIYVYPTTFLLNKRGEVVKTSLEGYNWLQEEAGIRKLLEQ